MAYCRPNEEREVGFLFGSRALGSKRYTFVVGTAADVGVLLNPRGGDLLGGLNLGTGQRFAKRLQEDLSVFFRRTLNVPEGDLVGLAPVRDINHLRQPKHGIWFQISNRNKARTVVA